MFSLADVDYFVAVNLKSDPEKAVELRKSNSGILPGYHLNKKHWNIVMDDDTVDDKSFIGLIDHSYALVVAGLSRKEREIPNQVSSS